VAEIDEGIDDEVSAEEVGGLAIDTNEQGMELVDPACGAELLAVVEATGGE